LGITLGNKHILKAALLEAVVNSADAESMGDNGFGETFVLRFNLVTDKGSATIMSAWIVRRNETFPRLTTCYMM
jgi:hypothetical protein